MINRDAVADIIGQFNGTYSGYELLTKLEDAGYRVVRSGMVPQFDDLDDVAVMLAALGRQSGDVQHNFQRANGAAITIRQLRDLALIVLRIDRADRDDVTQPDV